MDMREYLRQVLTSWWNLITVAGALIAIVSGVSADAVSPVVWIALIVVGVVLAQAHAYRGAFEKHRHTEVLGPGASELPRRTSTDVVQTLSADQPSSPVLDPTLLRGRFAPSMYLADVRDAEEALMIRFVLAGRVRRVPAPELGSEQEREFKEAVDSSTFERWVLDATHRVAPLGLWRSVDPTGSIIVSLLRPDAPVAGGAWTIEARASINLRPVMSMEPPGYGVMTLDATFRPSDDHASPDRTNVKAMSLEELDALLYIMLSSGIDQVAPTAFGYDPSTKGLVSVTCHIVVRGHNSLGDYVPLERAAWQRAEGTRDVLGGDWSPESYDEIASPERRSALVRSWIKQLLRNSGFRGHEGDIDRMPQPDRPYSGTFDSAREQTTTPHP